MSVDAASPITTYFRVCDGVRVRFADNRADSDITVLLLAPWPESLWAFRRIWRRVCGSRAGCRHRHAGIRPLRRSPGTDRPGRLGRVPGPPDRRVGPGGSARRRPGRRHGSGALPRREDAGARDELDDRRRCGPLPDRSGGALKDIIEAPSLDVVRGLDARTNIGHAVEAGAASDSEPEVHEDYVSAYDLGRFAESARFVRHYPNRTRSCATFSRRSPRRPRSSPDAMMTSCRGRTTSTSTTSSRTARFILSTPVTSRGSKRPRSTAAWSPIGSAADIGASERASCWVDRVVGPG